MIVPTIGSITPQSAEQGRSEHVSIHGDDFVAIDSITISGTGITVENAAVMDEHTIEFDVNVDANAAIGLRDVSVVLPDATNITLAASFAVTNFVPLLAQLRLMVGERVPAGGTPADTFFSDDELTDMIVRHSGNMYLAASEAWGAKTADRANLHDITESGSERKLSQLFRNAKAMQDGYASAGINAAQNLISPPVAKVASILGENTGRPSAGRGDMPVVDRVFDPFYNDPFLFVNAQRSWPILNFMV